jgi:3-phenylpropionate/trans-cinnamate dioxygenase ferredoxin subunit
MVVSATNLIQIGTTGELRSGEMKEVSTGGHEYLFARVGEAYYVTAGRCPHLGGHLAKGRLMGAIVTCPLHHSQFNLIDGHVDRWTDWPAAVLGVAKLFRPPTPLRTYKVRTEGDKVMIESR